MQIQENIPVQHLHTFGIKAKTQYLKTIESTADLSDFLQNEHLIELPRLILGGGSNLLFTKDFDGIILKNDIKGIKIIEEDNNTVTIKVGGGENWHQFVCWCVERNYGGIENLSLIPGTVGAAPIQNIGAYGVELKDVMIALEAFSLVDQRIHSFTTSDCQFGYRDSIFKSNAQYKGQYFITAVTFRLTTTTHHLNTNYGIIQKTLSAKNITQPTIKDISEAIIEIRSSKLPDPTQLGNSGSFFKNPIVDKAIFDKIYARYPQMPFYKMPSEQIKIPAGWLIEQCGWKGKRIGNTGAYAKQALVLVNYGNATGQEVKALAEAIQLSVKEEFGIIITPEVNMI